MNTNENILNELKEISSTVAAIPFVNVFTVPVDYFNTLQPVVMATISAAMKTDPFQNLIVPDGYFENLSDSIFKKIKAAENEVTIELSYISPLIAGIITKETYAAPEGYFGALTFVNQQKTEVAKVVKINRTKFVFKYAAAAVITGLLGISVINITYTNTKKPEEVIVSQTASVLKNADAILKTGSFDATLQTLSDNDIQQYLEQNGHDVNAALVASSTDEVDKLPEATDYLLDENVLENYLKDNNLKK